MHDCYWTVSNPHAYAVIVTPLLHPNPLALLPPPPPSPSAVHHSPTFPLTYTFCGMLSCRASHPNPPHPNSLLVLQKSASPSFCLVPQYIWSDSVHDRPYPSSNCYFAAAAAVAAAVVAAAASSSATALMHNQCVSAEGLLCGTSRWPGRPPAAAAQLLARV